MTLYIEKLDSGSTIFIHGELGEHCADCIGVALNLCDYPVGNGKTCDRLMCHSHSKEIATNIHYCQHHFEEFEKFRKNNGITKVLENVIPYKKRKRYL